MSKVFGQALLEDMVNTQSLPMPLVKQAAREILSVIREGLIQDGVVKISNFGTFRLKPVAARQGINPQTGKAITIPAQQRVIFSPCKALRDLIQPVYAPPVSLEPEQNPPDRPLVATAAAYLAPRDTAGKITDKPSTTATNPTGEIQLSEPNDSVPTASSTPCEPSQVIERPSPVPLPPSEDGVTEQTEHESGPREEETAIESAGEKIMSRQHETEERNETPVGPVTSVQARKKEACVALIEPVVTPLHNTTIAEFPPRPGNHTRAESETFPHVESPITEDTTPSPNRRYVFGAAAILLFTLIGAGLLIETEEDIYNIPPATVATGTVNSPPAMAPRSEPAPEALADEIPTTEETPNPIARSIVKEDDPSLHDTKTDNAVLAAKPDMLDDTAGNNEISVADSTAEVITSVSGSASSTVPRGSTYFFIEQPHEVSSGESLWRLARHHYQDPLLWPHIYQANSTTIDNPDHLPVGSSIAIPGLQGSPERLSPADRRHIANGYYLAYRHYKKIGRADALFALLEAKRYDSTVVEEHRSLMQLNKIEELQLAQQKTMPF